MSDFDLQGFWRFCAHLQINSKEYGTIVLDKPYGPQRWFMRQVDQGLRDSVHDFTVLKCRQIGLSTITQALDLYWLFTHPGMDGTIVTHDEETFVNFRTTLTEYYKSLPKKFKPRSPSHNRNEFVFRHPDDTISRLQYQIAGTRQSGAAKLGRAKGNAYLHATEMAFWGDQANYMSLRNSLAEVNPHRLYIWESTANGFNAFEEQWRVARQAATQRAIFIGWWAHELYNLDLTSQRGRDIYSMYWGASGKMTKEEKELAHDVALLYGDCLEFVHGFREIQPTQVAWYRYYHAEKQADEDMVKQEMPWTEHQAFVTTGSQYFSSRALTDTHKEMRTQEAPRNFRIQIGETLSDCRVLEVPPRLAHLTMWEGPQEKAHYVLGADPAYGSSDWADRFVISVWRCYADGIDQVAEYANADLLPYSFAWIMCYLGGCYAPCGWNLEINGPGAAVMGEMENLRRIRFAGNDRDRKVMTNFLGGMQEFLYARFDAISRIPSAKGTQSTLKEKNRYMDLFKDYYTRGMARPRSRWLLEEMKWITKEPGYAPAGNARHKDDRVIGAALAIQMWHDKMRTNLLRQNITRARTEQEPARRMNAVEALVARQRRILGM